MKLSERIAIIALFSVIGGLLCTVITKALEHEARTFELARKVEEQRAQLAIHTKALNELYGRAK